MVGLLFYWHSLISSRCWIAISVPRLSVGIMLWGFVAFSSRCSIMVLSCSTYRVFLISNVLHYANLWRWTNEITVFWLEVKAILLSIKSANIFLKSLLGEELKKVNWNIVFIKVYKSDLITILVVWAFIMWKVPVKFEFPWQLHVIYFLFL